MDKTWSRQKRQRLMVKKVEWSLDGEKYMFNYYTLCMDQCMVHVQEKKIPRKWKGDPEPTSFEFHIFSKSMCTN